MEFFRVPAIRGVPSVFFDGAFGTEQKPHAVLRA